MTNLLKRLALAAGANGLLLLLAAVLFDKFELSFIGWLIAAVLFTVLTLLLGGVMDALAGKYAAQATFLGGLATTWVALLITDQLTERKNFDLEGLGTWVLTVLIVWLGTVVYGLVDDRVVKKSR